MDQFVDDSPPMEEPDYPEPPEDVAGPAEPEPVASTPVAVTGSSPMQEVIQHAGAKQAQQLMATAVKYKLNEDDPAWLLVKAAVVSLDASDALTSAVSEVSSDLKRFKKVVYESAITAGNDIAGHVKQEVTTVTVDSGKALKALIDASAKAGAIALEKAASDIELKVQGVNKGIEQRLAAESTRAVEEYKVALQQAVKKQANMAIMGAVAKNMSIALVAMGISFVAGFAVDAMVSTSLPPHLHVEHIAGQPAYILVAPSERYFSISNTACSQGFCINYDSDAGGSSPASSDNKASGGWWTGLLADFGIH
jgi:hypothetical protein